MGAGFPLEGLVRPRRVKPGDVVAVVSPSMGAVGRWPHRVERAVAYLESLGLRVRFMSNAGRDESWVSAPAADRAADIHEAFLDDEVSVVIASIGGLHSNQVVPLLDWDAIAGHPKVFQGYSDITVLHWAMAKHAGLGTFYGPALVPTLGEHPRVLSYTDDALRQAWFGAGPLTPEPAAEWTDEKRDWNIRGDLERPRRMEPAPGWMTLRDGTARGWLFGGCLESIVWSLKGSAQWVDLEGAVLFLETADDIDGPADVDSFLTDLEQLGVFDSVTGLIVGRPGDLSPTDRDAYRDVFFDHTAASGIPVLADFDIGHTDPMLTLPLGAHIELDAGARTVVFDATRAST